MNRVNGPSPLGPNEIMSAIASLRGHPGFIALLGGIENGLKSLEAAMEIEKDEKKNEGNLRYWQFLRRIYRVLRDTPENMHMELDAMHPGYDFDAAETAQRIPGRF